MPSAEATVDRGGCRTRRRCPAFRRRAAARATSRRCGAQSLPLLAGVRRFDARRGVTQVDSAGDRAAGRAGAARRDGIAIDGEPGGLSRPARRVPAGRHARRSPPERHARTGRTARTTTLPRHESSDPATALLLVPACRWRSHRAADAGAEARGARGVPDADDRDDHAVLAACARSTSSRPPQAPSPQPRRNRSRTRNRNRSAAVAAVAAHDDTAGSAHRAESAPTQAEQDYDAIYGSQQDTTRSPIRPCPRRRELPAAYDPWEKLNRTRACASTTWSTAASPSRWRKPTSRWCRARCGWASATSSATSASRLSAVNSLLQGKPKAGCAGAGPVRAQHHARRGRAVRPGHAMRTCPTTARTSARRSACGAGSVRATWNCRCSARARCATCSAWSAMRRCRRCAASRTTRPAYFLQGLQLVDVRTQLLAVDSMREGATDDYALVRDAWMQRRNYQIFGDRTPQAGPTRACRDYLRDDDGRPQRAGRRDAAACRRTAADDAACRRAP